MADHSPVPIPIVGIGCRPPGGVADTEQLWQLLVEGRNAWSPLPAERYNEDAFYHPDPDNNGTINHRGGYFISQNIAAFDAAFFGVSLMDAYATLSNVCRSRSHTKLLKTQAFPFECFGLSCYVHT
ncbi:hypothetical protein N7G274_008878 [Stereocaulon virgatum]|uniref:Beta-ketoacyl synthase-like N-terminal domain-containing protein n=1 Tax=Stereocaulon virgatum TaxID=373712 RepID=A0ABR3ZYC4_9LECA